MRTLVGMAILVALFSAGCVLMGGQAFVTPATVSHETTTIETTPAGKLVKTVSEKTSSTGPSYRGPNAKGMDFSAPLLKFRDWAAQAGGLNFTGFDLSAAGNMKIVYIIGALGILAGFAAAWLVNKWLGIFLALGGVSVLAAGRLFDTYPWVGLLPLGVALAGGVVMLVELRRGTAATQSLQTVVKAVEDVSQSAQSEIKARVEKHAGKNLKQVKDTISNIKRVI